MRKERQLAFDKLFLLGVFFGLFLTCGSIVLFAEKNIIEGVVLGIIGLIIFTLDATLVPCAYIFDCEGVSICYTVFPSERYLWKNIRAIEVEDESIGRRANVLDLFYALVFAIQGECEGKRKFYMNGFVRKSRRTKRLFEKYWNGKIKGLFDDVKKSVEKKKSSKRAWYKAHAADKIVAMERKARAEVREWLKPFTVKAKEEGISIKADYVYRTSDGEELAYRPETGYAYVLLLKTERCGEIDERSRVDLLYVKLGKKEYQGRKNKRTFEELNLIFSGKFKND